MADWHDMANERQRYWHLRHKLKKKNIKRKADWHDRRGCECQECMYLMNQIEKMKQDVYQLQKAEQEKKDEEMWRRPSVASAL